MQLLRFAIVGGLVAASYIAFYLVLLSMSVAQPLANATAFLLAVALQYVGQASFTFRQQLADRDQIVRFVCMIGLGLATSAVITGILAPLLRLGDLVAALVVTVVLPVQNYLLLSAWVFQEKTQ